MIFLPPRAGVAQLVEYKLPKLGVAGSNPVARSNILNNLRDQVVTSIFRSLYVGLYLFS